MTLHNYKKWVSKDDSNNNDNNAKDNLSMQKRHLLLQQELTQF